MGDNEHSNDLQTCQKIRIFTMFEPHILLVYWRLVWFRQGDNVHQILSKSGKVGIPIKLWLQSVALLQYTLVHCACLPQLFIWRGVAL